jgi:hypothetical protein
MSKLYAIVKRGKAKGAVLTPHRHADGKYVVSKSRFEPDYVRVASEPELPSWVSRGYSIRMSNQEYSPAPSLIAPSSIKRAGDASND